MFLTFQNVLSKDLIPFVPFSGCETKPDELDDEKMTNNNGHDDQNADSAVIAVTSSVMEETTNESDIQVGHVALYNFT